VARLRLTAEPAPEQVADAPSKESAGPGPDD
jgi:hypothetical protein